MSFLVDDANSAMIHRGLSALHYWLFNFPQLEGWRRRGVVDNNNTADADDDDIDKDIVSVEDEDADFNNVDVVGKIVQIAKEICNDHGDDQSTTITSVGDGWAEIHKLLDLENNIELYTTNVFQTKEYQYIILRQLLCRALSESCPNLQQYVSRIMEFDRPDVQTEIMRILQEEKQHQCDGGSDVDNEEIFTGDYSAYTGDYSFAGASVTNSPSAPGAALGCESDMDSTKRDRGEAFANDNLEPCSPMGKRNRTDDKDDDDDDDHPFRERTSNHGTSKHNPSAEEADNLRATIAKLQKEVKESRQHELDLTLKVDEAQSHHRAEMLQVESKYLKTIRDMEDRFLNELSEQKRDIEMLRDFEHSAKELKDENLRLRDDLDVLACSKEKLSFTEEQLRKCREKVELIGDAHDALLREEKAHALSVDKCLALENELAQLKPLKRQLEEYRVRAMDAEVALVECRDDLRRVKEKSGWLEGTNNALQRGVELQHIEAVNLQKRLLEEGDKTGKGGTAVGIGMSELNPELMEELKTLRNEYARLKEFESKREVDSVQRLEENCDDAKRLSERYKEQFLLTKSDLEDTNKLLFESRTREAKLQTEVDDLTRCNKELVEETKDERLKSHKAALDAERNFQNEKKILIDKGRQDLIDMEERLTQKLEAERKQHKEKMDRAEAQRIEVENNLSKQLTELREQSSKTLRLAKELGQKNLDELELSKQAEVERVLKGKADEIEALMTKGKSMIRESRQKAKDLQRKITEEYEVNVKSLEEELAQVKDIQQEYEKVATAKIAKRDQQINVMEAKYLESVRDITELEDKVKKAERSAKDLAGENNRLRRQLGSRYGSDDGSQNVVEELASMCKLLKDENRRLKELNPGKLLSIQSDMHEPSLSRDDSAHAMTSFSKSTFTQIREEYEEKIEALEGEKQELVMKSCAAATETRKAEQRAWELEEELAKVQGELTSAKLALQRNERRSDFSIGLSSSSKKRLQRSDRHENENTPNIHNRGLPPSGAKKQDFTPKCIDPKNSQKKAAPLLMDHLNPWNDSSEAKPECTQS